jgi:hypothetical protein
LDLWGECDFLVQDYDQPWVRGRKYRIWGVFWFWQKKTRSLRERDVVKHGPYRTRFHSRVEARVEFSS